ncbi:hypothetical protein Vadar_013032 [Vaccinium darrowii]|uniref:Uncharacterized protein n=1 Tax=Vaccinium darrowii TaxID=229202 RepID=A0ACB7X9E3_9ERIC|nr:hypothetical protein Vadar_013032 [Vaccinium darrowii]
MAVRQKAVATLMRALRKETSKPHNQQRLPSLRRAFSLYDQVNLIDNVPEDKAVPGIRDYYHWVLRTLLNDLWSSWMEKFRLCGSMGSVLHYLGSVEFGEEECGSHVSSATEISPDWNPWI